MEPGANEEVPFSIKAEDMASYDAYGAGAYVLEAGDYDISVRSDSHTPVDSRTYHVNSTIVYNGDNHRSTDRIAAVNQFEQSEGDLTYLSRADGFANFDEVTKGPATYSMSDEYASQFITTHTYDLEAHNDPNDEMPKTGAKNGIVLADLGRCPQRTSEYGFPRRVGIPRNGADRLLRQPWLYGLCPGYPQRRRCHAGKL